MTMDRGAFMQEYRCYGNKMISELLDTFLKDYPEKVSALQNAVDEMDFDTIARLSHSLKGSVSVFCDDEATSLATELEIKAKTADTSGISLLLDKFILAIRQLHRDLSEIKDNL